MSFVILSFVMLMLFGIGAVIPVAVGVYVYRDAKRRGMNAAMWCLIAMIVPTLIGLIIYLLVRGGESDMVCPHCQTPIKEEYVRCPKCGSHVRPCCPTCAAPVEADWIMCPRCATPLPEQQSEPVRPVKRQDKSLRRILGIVILVPALLIVLLMIIFAMRMLTLSGAGGTSVAYAEAETYLELADSPELTAWYEQVRGDTRVHVLSHRSTSGKDKTVRYLVYLPSLYDPISVRFDNHAGILSNRLRIDYSDIRYDDSLTGELLVCLTCVGDDIRLAPSFYRDGEQVEHTVTTCATPIPLVNGMKLIGEVRYTNGGSAVENYVAPEKIEGMP